jgi:hypothetical protein
MRLVRKQQKSTWRESFSVIILQQWWGFLVYIRVLFAPDGIARVTRMVLVLGNFFSTSLVTTFFYCWCEAYIVDRKVHPSNSALLTKRSSLRMPRKMVRSQHRARWQKRVSSVSEGILCKDDIATSNGKIDEEAAAARPFAL